MRGSGQDRFAFPVGQPDQRFLHAHYRIVERVERTPKPEPQIRRDLVVPRATGVKAPGKRPDPRQQRRLQVHVHVFEDGIPFDRAGCYLGPKPIQTGD